MSSQYVVKNFAVTSKQAEWLREQSFKESSVTKHVSQAAIVRRALQELIEERK